MCNTVLEFLNFMGEIRLQRKEGAPKWKFKHLSLIMNGDFQRYVIVENDEQMKFRMEIRKYFNVIYIVISIIMLWLTSFRRLRSFNVFCLFWQSSPRGFSNQKLGRYEWLFQCKKFCTKWFWCSKISLRCTNILIRKSHKMKVQEYFNIDTK